MRLRRVLCAWLVVTGVGSSSPGDLRAAWFQGLGGFGGQSQAFGVSDDGSVVVGSSALAGPLPYRAFHWQSGTGMVPLDSFSLASDYAAALDISGDGSTAVGFIDDKPGGPRTIVRWRDGQPPVVLGSLDIPPDWPTANEARDASRDGAVIVGQSLGQAFRWDEANGMVGLGGLPGLSTVVSSANGVDDVGSVIVGSITTELGTQPFRWDADHGMIGLGGLPGGALGGVAQSVSADGLVIVGSSLSLSSMTRAFRWDAQHGMVELGELPPGYRTSAALDGSSDGTTAVGFISKEDLFGPSGSERAAYWDASGQLHELMVVLRAMGLDLTGWTLLRANAVSADGRTIVGTGINPTGGIEGWIAVIPEPGTAVLLGLGLMTLARAKGGGRPARRLV